MEPRSVLVIDDEQIVLDSIGKILREEGYRVETCLSGKRGIELAIRNEYDIVLTDIRMPDVGGMRVLRDVKRAKPVQAVVMITAFATVKSAVQAIQLGADDYLEKPFTPDDLLRSIDKAIENASSTPPDPPSVVHGELVLEVLERAAVDPEFVTSLFYHGVEALEEYDLTGAEKLAILTGDAMWIESHVGPLNSVQLRWLEQRLSSEIW